MSQDPIPRLNAALRDRYRVEREIGEGGMATVYLAEDLKHHREVALKVLKPELAAVVGPDRFLAEIQTTANLTHPHILPVHDSGEVEGLLFFVMPYIEGETLRDRLNREGQLAVEDAVTIAMKVCSALDYAHEHGVVHRDVKPGNILLTERGEPVVADFGIALAVAHAGAGRFTETGLSLGTPHYMSPEQATGDRDVTPRSDIYAVGCVLYEMLLGEPPFTGPSAQAVLGKIITGEVEPPSRRRRSIPTNVDAAVRKALEKLPADRFGAAADFAAVLADPDFRHGPAEREAVRAGLWKGSAVGFAALSILLAGIAAWALLRSPTPSAVPTTSILDLGDITLGSFQQVQVSPDGSRFAVAGFVDGESALFWRNADEQAFRRIPGSAGAREAAFSPDGDWLVFGTVYASLLKVSLLGGAPITIVPSGSIAPEMPYWGEDGTIVFSGPDGMYRVPDAGGEPVRLLGGGEQFMNPKLLPGGGGVIGSPVAGDRTGVLLLDLESDSVRELIPDGFDPQYVEAIGQLVYADDAGGLWAVPFDPERGAVTGPAVLVLDGLSVQTTVGQSVRFSVSRNGTVVYGAGRSSDAGEELVVVELDGTEQPLSLPPRDVQGVRWSPDGRTVVYESLAEGEGGSNLFLYDVVVEANPRPLTFEGLNQFPLFSPDGRQVVFSSFRRGMGRERDLFVRRLDDDSVPTRLLDLEGAEFAEDWPFDSLIVFVHIQPGSATGEIWTLDLSDPEDPQPYEYLSSEFDLTDPDVSPDGMLLAYESNETGSSEIYIRRFPDPGGRIGVSDEGGIGALWAPNGETLYYLRPGGGAEAPTTVVAARVERDPSLRVASRDSLFSMEGIRSLDLHPEGDRFIVARSASSDQDGQGESSEPERNVLITNWFEQLRDRVGE